MNPDELLLAQCKSNVEIDKFNYSHALQTRDTDTMLENLISQKPFITFKLVVFFYVRLQSCRLTDITNVALGGYSDR